jgi:hypothetical protein
MDPDTGEIVGSVDLGEYYVQYQIDPETGERTPLTGTMISRNGLVDLPVVLPVV